MTNKTEKLFFDPVCGLEVSTGDPRTDPPNVAIESDVGSTANPWRVPKTRHRDR